MSTRQLWDWLCPNVVRFWKQISVTLRDMIGVRIPLSPIYSSGLTLLSMDWSPGSQKNVGHEVSTATLLDLAAVGQLKFPVPHQMPSWDHIKPCLDHLRPLTSQFRSSNAQSKPLKSHFRPSKCSSLTYTVTGWQHIDERTRVRKQMSWWH